jgi:hypothetical protein
LLFTDFSDEMAARDEILKAADDPNVAPISTPAMPRPKATTTPPPIPQARSGEFGTAPHRKKEESGLLPAVPSMIVHQSGSGAIAAGQQATALSVPNMPALSMSGLNIAQGGQVIDLSTSVPVDTWMMNPDTNLLRAHRWKSLRNVLIALAVIGVLVTVAVFVLPMITASTPAVDENAGVGKPVDARVAESRLDAHATVEKDAGVNRDDIVALSKFGFFSINSNAKTSIYIDGKLIGETPLTRLPLAPGPHKVKAVGPKGKKKEFDIRIYGGRDTEEDPINW